MTDQRIHLVVLFGGQSAEHDVSRTTAAHVLAAVDPNRYQITPVGITRDGRWRVDAEAIAVLDSAARALGNEVAILGDEISPSTVLNQAHMLPATGNKALSSGQRVVVLPLLHGPMGEDGTIQGLLELANVPYVGAGVLGSAVAMDKAMAKTIFAAAGIPQARYHTTDVARFHADWARFAFDDLGAPVFVKPANMGSSVGVSKASTLEQFHAAIELAFTYDEIIVVEAAVSGREIELAVIGNDDPFVSVPGEIVPADEFYSYDDKYVNGMSGAVIPAALSDAQVAQVQQLARTAFHALRGSGLARCDFFLDDAGQFVCNEINTMPGFTPISMFPKLLMASGWTYAQIIDRLVDLAVERHARRRRKTER